MSKIAFTTEIIVILCITAGFNSVANAQTASPIFGDMTIQHPFSPDPLTVRGMSGGSIPGSKIAGKAETAPTGPCKGFVDETPDHTLKLTSKFDYLKLVVQSPADTTMIVKGPGGTWCNDDFDGKNPGIVGEWLPGTYQIWIGSYQENESLPYTLKITEVK
ncbi:hypothetical protein [Anabaena sp. UHCC 0187]|uniref:hypothetical protein n=1 Tax=Anabaena sp. UHCC 0187 TaxID=2590018 RepID=UPI00158116CC|nr:hypothetical protein [Anabaena sp. UHCC 0187]